MVVLVRAPSMLSSRLPRGSISAALQSRRALLLAEGRRRFYVFPLDVGPHSKLGKIPHASKADCIASAHAWLQRAMVSGQWWFSIVERAELGGESCHAFVQDILVFNDLLPLRSGSEVTGDSIRRAGPEGPAKSGESVAAPGTGTFKATDWRGVPCRRRKVPQHG